MPMSPRLLRPRAAGGFDPRAVANLSLWYDASDASTITLNGSTVSEWRSKGTRNLAAAQTTAALQPTYTASAVGGRPALTTSTTCGMTVPAFPFTNTVTSFVVMAISGSTDVFPGIWCRGAINATHLLWWTGGNVIARRSSGFDSQFSQSFSSTYFIARAEFSSTLTRAARNGVPATSNTSSFSASSADQNLTLFRFPANNGFFGGIAEFLYYERNLSDTETATIEQYLSRKYGITLA